MTAEIWAGVGFLGMLAPLILVGFFVVTLPLGYAGVFPALDAGAFLAAAGVVNAVFRARSELDTNHNGGCSALVSVGAGVSKAAMCEVHVSLR